jgi:hypothetical protein
MLYGSHYMEAANGFKTGDGTNGMKVGDGGNGANGINGNGVNGIQTGNAIKLTNDKRAVDDFNGVAHT